jgi:hypothetical protein
MQFQGETKLENTYFKTTSRLKRLWCGVLHTADAFALAKRSEVTQRNASTTVSAVIKDKKALLRVQGCISPAGGSAEGSPPNPLPGVWGRAIPTKL